MRRCGTFLLAVMLCLFLPLLSVTAVPLQDLQIEQPSYPCPIPHSIIDNAYRSQVSINNAQPPQWQSPTQKSETTKRQYHVFLLSLSAMTGLLLLIQGRLSLLRIDLHSRQTTCMPIVRAPPIREVFSSIQA